MVPLLTYLRSINIVAIGIVRITNGITKQLSQLKANYEGIP